jgi:hypothetical protein
MCCGGNRPKVYFVAENEYTGLQKIVRVCLGGNAYNGFMAGSQFDGWYTLAGPYQIEENALSNYPDALSLEEGMTGDYQESTSIKCPTWLVAALVGIGFIIILSSHGKIK